MKRRFVRAEAKLIDDLPDHIQETIAHLTEKVLLTACVDINTGRIEPNLSLGAIQRALCLLIAKFFKEEQLDQIIDQVYAMMKENVHLWKKDNEVS